jgi:hypothetical protein
MPPDEACECAQGLVRFCCPGEHGSNVRVERYYDATLRIAGRVLVWPSSAEVVLRKDLVDPNLTRRRLSSFCSLHGLSVHGVWPSVR